MTGRRPRNPDLRPGNGHGPCADGRRTAAGEGAARDAGRTALRSRRGGACEAVPDPRPRARTRPVLSSVRGRLAHMPADLTSADWSRLENGLRRVLGAPHDTKPAGGPLTAPPDVGAVLHAAYLLVLDGRADYPSLQELIGRGAFTCLPALLDLPTGTAAGVAAVLAGWEAAGVGAAGAADIGAGRRDAGPWTGRSPLGPAEVMAVWHADAAARDGVGPAELRRLAGAGSVTLADAPEPD